MRRHNNPPDLREKKIWIDLDNSPHVPFFNPIIKELKQRDCLVTLTARDCFQVCGLADLFGLQYKKIGRHYGKSKILKVIGTIVRSIQLLPIALRERPTIAVSHGSRSQLITAKMLRIPGIKIFDYEFAKGLGLILPDWVIAPEIIPDKVKKYNKGRFLRYPGIKEDVYAPFFKPDPNILRELGVGRQDIIVTIRPPATEAHYHNPESEKLFVVVVNLISENPDVRIVILPRNERKQTAWIKGKWAALFETGKIIIPDHVVNGLNLIWFSDLVISGGGTMNREAAALGVPVYSIFRGHIGAVDRYLSDKGRLIFLESEEDVRKKIKVTKRNILDKPIQTNKDALKTIINLLLDIVGTS